MFCRVHSSMELGWIKHWSHLTSLCLPGSYSVLSSKGFSDHHIVKADVIKVDSNSQQFVSRKRQQPKHKDNRFFIIIIKGCMEKEHKQETDVEVPDFLLCFFYHSKIVVLFLYHNHNYHIYQLITINKFAQDKILTSN